MFKYSPSTNIGSSNPSKPQTAHTCNLFILYIVLPYENLYYQFSKYSLLTPYNNNNIFVPYSFIIDKTSLSWNEVYFGIQTNFLKLSTIIEKAEEELSKNNVTSNIIFETAILYKREEISIEEHFEHLIVENIIDKNKMKDPKFIERCKNKFLYLLFSYLYCQGHKDISMIQIPLLYSVLWDFKGEFSAETYTLESNLTDPKVNTDNKETLLEILSNYLIKQKKLIE